MRFDEAASPPAMNAVEIVAPGGPEVLRPCRRPVPAPGPGEALIRVAAAGVNRPDVLQRMGLYPPPPGASDLPGLEVAGKIEALGRGVDDLQIGDPVCALLPGGGYAEYALAPAGSCLPVPAGLSAVEAASLPEAVFTVWANVFDDADLKAGETLFLHGGTSGIGVTAIGLAKAFGARVIATAGSREKVAAALACGADAAFHYEEDAWDVETTKLGGADVALDMAGGDFLIRTLGLLNPFGRCVSIAFLRGARAEIDIFTIMRKRLRLTGSTLKARSIEDKARLARGIRTAVWPLIEAGRFSPRIDRVFPLADAADAHRRMEAGDHVGKIVLAVSDLKFDE